ncbi:basic proline-rich protein-like [Suricata suricatta]|uniref:basic proline-rich protein-like n=1 Tax=Suricata suricatta TaxID=37032 RepID=UPI0011554452|nr:basic proline-rich protein-like [Suricata suricatta]
MVRRHASFPAAPLALRCRAGNGPTCSCLQPARKPSRNPLSPSARLNYCRPTPRASPHGPPRPLALPRPAPRGARRPPGAPVPHERPLQPRKRRCSLGAALASGRRETAPPLPAGGPTASVSCHTPVENPSVPRPDPSSMKGNRVASWSFTLGRPTSSYKGFHRFIHQLPELGFCARL